jgi:hypothetical protein
MTLMTRFGCLVAGTALLASAGCDLTKPSDIPLQDKPSVNALEETPTPSIIYAATQGLLDGLRQGTTDLMSSLAHHGREGYYLAVARTVLDEFDDPIQPGGGVGWGSAYNYIRTGNSILNATDKVSGMSVPNQEAVRGFVKTVEAFLLLGQIHVHDTFGIVVQTNQPRSELGPLATKAEAYAYIAKRLDDAAVHLRAAGPTFPFLLSAGFAGFNTPVTFLRFNRALRARAANDNREYAVALTALAESFINPTGDLATGVYNTFSTASGDRPNPYFDPTGLQYLADTMLVVQAQRKADAAIDDRLTRKVLRSGAVTHTRVTSNLRWVLYGTNVAPIPVIKNEELILIRAEAKMFTGDRAGALADLNIVRSRSGGLPALTADPGDPGLLNELLYNRRYSLLFEWGHRWFDLRKHGLLSTVIGPRGAGDRIHSIFPLPRSECDQRALTTAACSQQDGTRTTR